MDSGRGFRVSAMRSTHLFTLTCAALLAATGFTAVGAEPIGGSGTFNDVKPSKVLRLEIPKLVQGHYDVVVTLYQRNDVFHLGYAEVPERDNMVHRIDVAPSPPFAFVWAKDGKEIDVPEKARGYYSYKDKDFLKYKDLYNKGEVDIKHTSKVPPLTLKGDKLSGMMEIRINHVDAVNGPSRGKGSLVYRMTIDAKEKKGAVTGKAVYWQYRNGDYDYGKDSARTTVEITGKWVDDHWKARSGSNYAKGKDWPMAHGPNLTGAAIDSDTPLVKTLHDARLLWVADLPLGAGRGGGLMRGNFCMYPINWATLWEAGYGAPIMADNKVFVYAPSPDFEALNRHPDLARNPYYRLGAKAGLMANTLKKHRESVFAFDARTGALLWQYHGKPGTVGFIGGKSGKASTPCYYDGKVYTRVNGGVLCLDANTGEKIWLAGPGIGSGSSDASVTQVGGTLIVVSKPGDGYPSTVGLDPKDGSVKWTVDGFGATGYGIPGLYREQGREYMVLGRPAPDPKSKGEKPAPVFAMVDPVDGKVLWESDALAYNHNHILVFDDMAIGNFKKGDPKAKHATSAHRVAGVKISTKGAKRLWVNEEVNPQACRNMYIAKNGVFHSDSRSTRFTANDIKTGKLLQKKPNVYSLSHVSHNWSWIIGSNDRILSEGIMMYDTADGKLDLFPGRLGNSVSGGYRSPTKPLIADGRLIFRMPDKLVCYDLRMHEDAAKTEVINLVAEKAAVVGPNEFDVKIRIRKRGDKLISLGGKAPDITSKGIRRVIDWGPQDWSQVSWYRTVIPHDMTLTDDSLKGKARVRLGYQYERFAFDLKRDGDAFAGTYTRTVKPQEKPVKAEGEVVGPILSNADGSRDLYVYLSNGGMSVGALADGGKPHAGVGIIVAVDKSDKVTGIGMAAGRMCRMSHEVDVEELTVKGNTIKGKVTVIIHDDKYGDFDFKSARAEFRSVGEGGAVAYQYSFEATGVDKKDEKTGETKLENKGKFTGTLGVAWRKTGTISGRLEKE